jgi:hypothetical protein
MAYLCWVLAIGDFILLPRITNRHSPIPNRQHKYAIRTSNLLRHHFDLIDDFRNAGGLPGHAFGFLLLPP